MLRPFLLELIAEFLISRISPRWTVIIYLLVAVLVISVLLRQFM